MDIKQVTETIAMIEEQNFDVRTITMGISLLDCIDSDIDKAAEKVYNKIVSKAKNLVAVGDEIAAELGIPIVNKRVSVTPISIIGAATDATDYVPFAKALDRAAKEIGVNFIGGFSALVQKGYQKGDEILINSIPRALAETDFVCSSVNIGSTKTGINMTAVRDMGRIIKEASEADPLGPGKLVVFANAVEDNPFMAIIFCRTKRRADALELALHQKGYNCQKIHSDVPQPKRERIIKAFRNADIQYLIATDVAARGIDISGVTHIYNYDTPETPESYIHRIGRTGRAGEDGYTCMFVAPKDENQLKEIEEKIGFKINRREIKR